VFPIQCSEEDKNRVQHELPCQLLDFLCRYLGLPLTLKRLSRVQMQPFIDRIADQLPSWKADLLSKPGRDVGAVCFHKHADLPCHGN
jgi:hypothetical protein